MTHFFAPIGPGLVRKPHLGGVPWMHVHPARNGRKVLYEGLRFETREDFEAAGYIGWEVA